MEYSMTFWLGFYAFFLVLSTLVGIWKKNIVAGVLLGYVFGPIGFILLLLSHDRRHKQCPHCEKKVDSRAYFCPHCTHKCYGSKDKVMKESY
ncbi:hypothetical protein EK599_08695 [Vibrio sp. T187]|nr:hypothetical protein [Vibrio sp. T187]